MRSPFLTISFTFMVMACGLCFSCCGWCGTLRYRDFTLKGTQLLFAFSGTFNRFDVQALFVLPCVCAQELTFCLHWHARTRAHTHARTHYLRASVVVRAGGAGGLVRVAGCALRCMTRLPSVAQVLIINITAALGLFSLARLVVEFTLEFLLSRRRK